MEKFVRQPLSATPSPVSEGKPTPPEPFGFKTGWIVVRSTDQKAVAAAIPFAVQTSASWKDGIDAAYKGGVVFITPPVNGWIAIVGEWALGNGDKQSIESLTKTVSELSSQFGEAQGFGSHRVVEYHHWILARQGRLVRCFAYNGSNGEALCQSGLPTDTEKKLRNFADLSPNQWIPIEDDVMAARSPHPERVPRLYDGYAVFHPDEKLLGFAGRFAISAHDAAVQRRR